MPEITRTLLASTLTLPCGQELPSRLGKAALSEQLSDAQNRPTEALVRLYERWANGLPGFMLTGNVMIDATALEEPRNVVIEDDRDMDMLRRWATAAQRHGAPCWVQLSHPGRQSIRTLSPEPLGPSAVSMTFGRGLYVTPRAMTEEEIAEVIARFARSAQICRDAGFAGVQIHAAHGYLISSFLSPLTNQRTDRWGGSADNRLRLLLEVFRAVREATGPEFGVGVKLNSADFQRGGFDEEASMEVAVALEEAGVDMIEISGGSYESATMMGVVDTRRASTVAREAYFMTYAEAIRKRVSVPLMLTGGFRTTEGMEEALSSGAVDLIGLGRPLCINPDLPRQILDGTVTRSVVTPKQVGVRELDTILEVFFYTQQLHRLAAGKEAVPERNVFYALAVAVSTILWHTVTLSRPDASNREQPLLTSRQQ